MDSIVSLHCSCLVRFVWKFRVFYILTDPFSVWVIAEMKGTIPLILSYVYENNYKHQ